MFTIPQQALTTDTITNKASNISTEENFIPNSSLFIQDALDRNTWHYDNKNYLYLSDTDNETSSPESEFSIDLDNPLTIIYAEKNGQSLTFCKMLQAINFANNQVSLEEKTVAIENFFQTILSAYEIHDDKFLSYISSMRSDFLYRLPIEDISFIVHSIQKRLQILEDAINLFYQFTTDFLKNTITLDGHPIIYSNNNKICLKRLLTTEEFTTLETLAKNFSKILTKIECWNPEYLWLELARHCPYVHVLDCIKRIITDTKITIILDAQLQPRLHDIHIKFVIFSKLILRKAKHITELHKKSIHYNYSKPKTPSFENPNSLDENKNSDYTSQDTYLSGEAYFLLGAPGKSLHERLLRINLSNYEKKILKVFLLCCLTLATHQPDDQFELLNPEVIINNIVRFIAPIRSQYGTQYTLGVKIYPFVNWMQICSLLHNNTAPET